MKKKNLRFIFLQLANFGRKIKLAGEVDTDEDLSQISDIYGTKKDK